MPRSVPLSVRLAFLTLLAAAATGCRPERIPRLGPGPAAAVAAPAGELDYETYGKEAMRLLRFDPGGRIRRTRWSADGRTLTFNRLGTRFVFDLEQQTLAEVPADETEAGESGGGAGEDRRPPRRRGPARGHQREREPSPDGKWVAVARDWNVRLEAKDGDETIPVTTGGTRKLRYGRASWVYGEELRQTRAMWWSPDSRTLVFYEFDEREVPDYQLLGGLTDLRPHPMLEGYPKPGEPNPAATLIVYDLASRRTLRLDTDGSGAAGAGPWYVYDVRFTPGGSEILFNRTNRHQNVLHVEAADRETGRIRTVVTETQATWQTNRPTMQFLADGRRFVWETERTGRRQFELRDLDGHRLAALSDGSAPAVRIVRVDEDAGVVYYTAYDQAHPLDEQLYRVNLDGTGRRRLTTGAVNHTVEVSPDGRWFIDRAETLSQPPTTALFDTDGHRVAGLAESDAGRIAALGYPAPELFSFKADDGETDLYGWLYKPRGFDPARRYPLLIDVYGGPESKGVRDVYRPAHPGVVSGYLVAKIDNRGTAGRGKAFLGAVYRKLGIVDIKDQADGVRHLLKRPYIDPRRVGIVGHSYGGYMAALAILKYPDLFQVAVAGSAVTDWRNYDTIYTERYMQTPEENPGGYEDGSCLSYAKNLKGHLLLMHGMVDDNVHPTNVWQLAHALQDAGKSFRVMFYPNSGHGLAGHARRVRWEFLREHLAGGG